MSSSVRPEIPRTVNEGFRSSLPARQSEPAEAFPSLATLLMGSGLSAEPVPVMAAVPGDSSPSSPVGSSDERASHGNSTSESPASAAQSGSRSVRRAQDRVQ